MAKVEVKTETIKMYALTLSEAEAKIVMTLTGYLLGGNNNPSIHADAMSVFNEMSKAGVRYHSNVLETWPKLK